MRAVCIYILLSICCATIASGQTLNEAKELFKQGKFAEALPIFETEYNAKPTDPNFNQWYGVCLFETNQIQRFDKVEECLIVASKKKIQESFFYLGQLYALQYRFSEAKDAYDKYEAMLKKKDDPSRVLLEAKRKEMSRTNRIVSNTEDIQIIDSVVLDKTNFLSAYKMSLSSGRLDYFDKIFKSNQKVASTVYSNERGSKIYYGQPVNKKGYSLFSMEKLLDKYGNEKPLSADNFGLTGDLNYPYMMPDGVTIYFAAHDEETIGGYDLFVSRYNMNNDTFLTPERLSMPFNSDANDYLMVVDEEKGIGWFASDRSQPEGKVCVYTFIPNDVVKIVDSDDEKYLANRAKITSIKSSWATGQNYQQLIATARKEVKAEEKIVRDFEFVVNDKYTYYTLTDFKNKGARDAYGKLIQLKNELKTANEKLDAKRDSYASSNQEKRRQMTTNILNQEKNIEQLQKEISLLETLARNQEAQMLK